MPCFFFGLLGLFHIALAALKTYAQWSKPMLFRATLSNLAAVVVDCYNYATIGTASVVLASTDLLSKYGLVKFCY